MASTGGLSGPRGTGVCATNILPMSHRSSPSRILIDRQLPVYALSAGVEHLVGADTPDLHERGSILSIDCQEYNHDLARITCLPSSSGSTHEL